MSNHAFLSPSAAHRWMNCPQAPALEATVERTTSVFAEEGTLAHAICEAKLRNLINPTMPAEAYYIADHNGELWTNHELYKPEMEEFTDYYRDVICNKLEEARKTTPDAILDIEKKLDFSTWVPSGFGTADAVIIADGTMDVIDFKYGKGVMVSAHDNPQMQIYALGAKEYYETEFDINRIRMTIIQPRLDNVSEYTIDAYELDKWGEKVLKPAAEKAYKKVYEQHAGPWCKFCAVKARCKELARFAAEATEADPRLMTNQELAEALSKVSTIKTWCGDVEEYALGKAIEGEKIPGYKIVEGRSVRVISDEGELVGRLIEAGYSVNSLYKPRELQTITNLEKLVGKKTFTAVAEGCITKPQGKPTLAPESDKRKEWSSAENDFNGITLD